MRFLFFMGALLATKAAAACETPTHVADLVQVMEAGEMAFVDLNKELVRQDLKEAQAIVGCLNEQIGTSEVARLHRFAGFAAFVEKNREAVEREFALAIVLEPHYVLPEGIVPSDHPVAILYEQAMNLAFDSDRQIVLVPQGGWSTVDGVRTNERRSAASAVVQIMDARGAVVDSRFLVPMQLLPSLDLSQYNIDLTVKPRSIFKSKPAPWLIASATGLVVSGALYGVAMYEKSRFEDTVNPVPDDELVALQSATNALGIAWVGATALTAATGIVTFTVVIPNHHKGAP